MQVFAEKIPLKVIRKITISFAEGLNPRQMKSGKLLQ